MSGAKRVREDLPRSGREVAIRLHVNVDHVATLRNARGTPYPDPVLAADECLDAGAHGITAHLREDRRHIVDDDVARLRVAVARAGRTFNLEMAGTDEMVDVALRVKPDICTIVPERRQERTTEGGLDVIGGGGELERRVSVLLETGIKVSLFVAPDVQQIDRSKAIGATQIELHTGEFAHGRTGELERLAYAAKRARACGLEVAAGHGLTQLNLPALVVLPELVELNIGHAVVSDAVFVGLAEAVRAYRRAIDRGVQGR
jgi:pyridoxine 5-phosphate synthase